MGMEITNNYNNYAIQDIVGNSTVKISKKKTGETSASDANKVETVKKANENSQEEYLEKLQKQIPDMKLKAGKGFAEPEGNITHCITINPKLLEKMQNDPQAAKEYTRRLEDIQRASNYVMNFYKAKGDVVYYNDQWYIDENGNHSHFAQSIIKDRLNERLRKEAEENAKKHIEKMRENARKKAEELAGRLEEKAEKTKKEDGRQNDDTQTIIEAAKERNMSNTKEQSKVGANIDLQV